MAKITKEVFEEVLKLKNSYDSIITKQLSAESTYKVLLASTIKDLLIKRKDGIWKDRSGIPDNDWMLNNLRMHDTNTSELSHFLHYQIPKKRKKLEESAKELCDYLRSPLFLKSYYSITKNPAVERELSNVRIELRKMLVFSKEGKKYLTDCIKNKSVKHDNNEYYLIHSNNELLKSQENIQKLLKKHKIREEKIILDEALAKADVIREIILATLSTAKESLVVINDTLALEKPLMKEVKITLETIHIKSYESYRLLAMDSNTLWAPEIKETKYKEVFSEIEGNIFEREHWKTPKTFGKTGKYLVKINQLATRLAAIGLAYSFFKLIQNPKKEEIVSFSGAMFENVELFENGLKTISSKNYQKISGFVGKLENKFINASVNKAGLPFQNFKTTKLIAGIGALIGVAVSFHSASNSYNEGQSGYVVGGHVTLALVGLLGLIPGFGWVAFGIIFIGNLAIGFLNDNDAELWFLHSFFGKKRRNLPINSTKDISNMYYQWDGGLKFLNQINQYYKCFYSLFTIDSVKYTESSRNFEAILKISQIYYQKEMNLIFKFLPSGIPFKIKIKLEKSTLVSSGGDKYKYIMREITYKNKVIGKISLVSTSNSPVERESIVDELKDIFSSFGNFLPILTDYIVLSLNLSQISNVFLNTIKPLKGVEIFSLPTQNDDTANYVINRNKNETLLGPMDRAKF